MSAIYVDSIKDKSDTKTLATLSSSAVTLHNDVTFNSGGCKVYRSSNQTITTGTYTKVQFNAEVFDTLTEFDSSTNHRYVAGTAGIYLLNSTLMYADMGDTLDMICEIRVNNTAVATFDHKSSSTNYESVAVTVVQNLSASDYVEVFTKHMHGADRLLFSGQQNTYFCVQRLA